MPSEFIQRQIDRLLEQAAEALSQSNWALVRDRARNVLALDPDNGDAAALLADAQRIEDGAAPSPEPAASAAPSDSTPEPARTLPISFVNGRYVVKRFLGEGGKKIVYETNDNILDRDVAYAEIKTEGLDDVGRQRIKR
ncbi:MAG: hypothetical protein EXR50_07655, partial [Dehalococcoidia bacterium]|nr:hypothetical protein [Dehalococcoidia bacterium]